MFGGWPMAYPVRIMQSIYSIPSSMSTPQTKKIHFFLQAINPTKSMLYVESSPIPKRFLCSILVCITQNAIASHIPNDNNIGRYFTMKL